MRNRAFYAAHVNALADVIESAARRVKSPIVYPARLPRVNPRVNVNNEKLSARAFFVNGRAAQQSAVVTAGPIILQLNSPVINADQRQRSVVWPAGFRASVLTRPRAYHVLHASSPGERSDRKPIFTVSPACSPAVVPSSLSSEGQDECFQEDGERALDMPGALMYPRSPFLECLFVHDLSLICVRSKGRIRVLVPSNGILCARACDCRPQYVCAGTGARARAAYTYNRSLPATEPGAQNRDGGLPKVLVRCLLVPCLRPKCARDRSQRSERDPKSESRERFDLTGYAAVPRGADKRMIDPADACTRGQRRIQGAYRD